MAALSSLKTGLRPVHFRIAVFFRLETDTLPLPDFLKPRRVRDRVVVAVCFTQLENLRSRFLPTPLSVANHLVYRIAADRVGRERTEDCRATWVLRRESSTRMGSTWPEGLARNPRSKASFLLDRDGHRISLSVTNRDEEVFFLDASRRAHVDGETHGRLFTSPESVRSFFAEAGEILPAESAADPVDGMREVSHLTLEPLHVEETRSSLLDNDTVFREGAAILDSAWCWSKECTTPLARKARKRSASLGASRRGLDSDALPAL